jgi:DNA-binding NtrC family response regulator
MRVPERILVVEDHADLLAFCSDILQAAGYDVLQADSGVAAEALLRTSNVDVVVTDLKLPAKSGLEVLRASRQADPETIVILMTGYPTVETAVNAMKCGAADYLLKPFSADQLLAAVEEALERRRTKEAHRLLRSQLRQAFTLSGIVGRAQQMLRLFDEIRNASAVDSNVVILGESGAGKERVARTIHENSSRRHGPFLAINCAAIPDTLLEAELFGYERGAFTGAQTSKEGLLQAANGGTLFLDEICELSPALQAKLLRAVEEGSVRRLGGRKSIALDVRFMASTNRDIRDELRRGQFREDFFFRINVIEIRVPPLRERREDIPLLAAHFLEACARHPAKKIDGISQKALDVLIKYDWPGNVRELKNAVERAFAYTKGPFVAPEDLPDVVLRGAERHGELGFRAWKERTFERLELAFLKRSLDEHAWNVSRAAKALRLHRSTLQRFMRRHNLTAMPAVGPFGQRAGGRSSWEGPALPR